MLLLLPVSRADEAPDPPNQLKKSCVQRMSKRLKGGKAWQGLDFLNDVFFMRLLEYS